MLGAICSKNFFSCENGKCVSPALVGNGHDDCENNIDETVQYTGICRAK